MSKYTNEIEKRRTFAIISHPDAGKTTLTEKFLLYGGAINLAGSVKGKATARHAVSDWMEIEKERGISVTSSVLQFHYDGYCINILDTPGHQDFSEDTYRTLMAADSAVMVIDGSKGVEAQTRKLFKVCVLRDIPIFTFINKFDREARDPYELLDEIEKVAAARGLVQDILLEVNIGAEESKSGFTPAQAMEIAAKMAEFPHCRLRGLMAIPPVSTYPGENRRYFAEMRNLFVDISKKKYDNVAMECLSMGMSGDYADAIAEGATMIRVGTAIFGPRNYNV